MCLHVRLSIPQSFKCQASECLGTGADTPTRRRSSALFQERWSAAHQRSPASFTSGSLISEWERSSTLSSPSSSSIMSACRITDSAGAFTGADTEIGHNGFRDGWDQNGASGRKLRGAKFYVLFGT